MRVWTINEQIDHEEFKAHGVFASEELANKYVSDLCAKSLIDFDNAQKLPENPNIHKTVMYVWVYDNEGNRTTCYEKKYDVNFTIQEWEVQT